MQQNVSHSRQDEWWHVADEESSRALARIAGQLATRTLLSRGTTSAGLACRVSLVCVNRLVILDHKLGVAEREWAENPTLYQRELAQETAMYPPWLLGWEIPERRTGMSVAIRYVSPEEINALGFVHVNRTFSQKICRR
jgi:hypothetical protein